MPTWLTLLVSNSYCEPSLFVPVHLAILLKFGDFLPKLDKGLIKGNETMANFSPCGDKLKSFDLNVVQ